MRYLLTCLTAFLLLYCSNPAPTGNAESALDAGREFVRAALDGDYKKAGAYLLKDSMNLMLFAQQQTNYASMSPEQKRDYKESSIRPVAILSENDTVTQFRYYHSANPTDTTNLRIVKSNGKWLVDLKSVIKM